ncbi:hypothetical protein [Amycolatopsis cihanbeyliensis]|uniref:Type VII secretion system (Wss) protein ESAT-6 n=1 Tax=Amycolatopsis cihanbeyliensis TaxID=1128664 RepID=A0A542CTE4_AMYCI|nr:hypothetical protein [Amycolatopsis cihanbeyliensis]TQI94091.1 hypothetical protein FB471_6244 [Amycolatopsis cihanbeyliensis]
MSIDTKIEGNPENVRGVSNWLRDSLAAGVSDAAGQIYQARNSADAGWQGEAGEAFSGKMTTAARKTDELAAAANTAAQNIDTYAAELHRAQEDMRGVRERAAAAGLMVNGDLIEDPGKGPPAPGAPPTGDAVTPGAVSAHNDAVAASNAHASKVAAYNTAKTESEAAKHIAKLAAETVKNAWQDIKQKPLLAVGDLTNGTAAALAAKHASILGKQAKFLSEESVKLVERARAAPAGTNASQIYRDFDAGRAVAYQADDVAAAAKNVDGNAAKWGFRAGGALAAAGVVYDIANGKPVAQAVTSGAVGFGASMAAGAAVGSFIPVPVAGTVVGAIVGAGVGVFTSGMVDSLWENGVGAVGDAIEDGLDAVGDTAEAVGGVIGDAWDAIF